MKETLSSKCISRLSSHLVDGVVEPDSYKPIIKELHTSFVAAAISKQSDNYLLDARPPKVSSSELSLLRPHRSALAQLRSGACPRLNDVRHRYGWEPSAVCPECGIRRHTVPHLFICDAAPVFPPDLNIRDLWTNPRLVISFLVTLSSFSDLPPLPPDPPPPRPPPEPPPPAPPSRRIVGPHLRLPAGPVLPAGRAAPPIDGHPSS